MLGPHRIQQKPKCTEGKVNAAEVLIERLIAWNVDVIFGLPGDGINGIMEALRTRQDKVRFVQVRHEESAAFMACAYNKTTGRLGVCLATSGPGGIHLANGLYDAKLDGAAVLAITGSAFHDLTNTHTQQDVELDKLYMDVAMYNNRIMGAAHVENVVDIACRTALAYHGVAHITIAADLQEQALKKDMRSERNIAHHSADIIARSSRLPNEEDLRKAADLLNCGRKVAILAGRGALGACEELEALAEKLAGPIIKPLLGKACVPDDSPYTTGGIGLLGTKPSQEALEDCDTLLMIGTSFPYVEFYPEPGKVRAVQVELDPMMLGLRYPIEIGLIGDSKRTIQALLPMLERKNDRRFLEAAQSGMRDWNKSMLEQGTSTAKPMKPQVVAYQLGQRLKDDAIVCCDSGTITTWWARHVHAKRNQIHTLSGNLATMACGLPYAIGAQVAHPGRQVVAFVGDGGFSMLMADFVTAVKYNLPIKVVVIKNNTLGQIKWEQMVFLGNPEFGCDLHPIDFAEVAHAMGGVGLTIDDAADCGRVMDEFLNAPGPALLQAVVDPFTPPLPAKIKVKQALHFAESLAKGEPNREKIAITAFSDKVREMI